jgi:hypothetical protein
MWLDKGFQNDRGDFDDAPSLGKPISLDGIFSFVRSPQLVAAARTRERATVERMANA